MTGQASDEAGEVDLAAPCVGCGRYSCRCDEGPDHVPWWTAAAANA